MASQPVTPDPSPSGTEPRTAGGGSSNPDASGNVTSTTGTSNTNIGAGASAAGDGIVWASTQLAIGPWKLPITTRGLKDAAVIGAAVVIGVLGIVLMTQKDLKALAGKLPPIIPV